MISLSHHNKDSHMQLTVLGELEGIIEWLDNLREVRAEGKLGDDMRQIHD